MRAPSRTFLALPALALLFAVVMGPSPAMAISERAGAQLRRAPARLPHAAPPAVPAGGNGLIAFQSDRADGGETQLFTMDTDGSGPAQLTFHNQSSTEASWAPDGTGLAYSNCCPADTTKREIYSVNGNGDGRVRLTDNDAKDIQPSWSPDGSEIAFASRRDGNWEIYVMNADGSGQVNLTDDSNGDKSPAWGPQGNWIAFSSNRGSKGNWQVYKMRTDGS